MAYSFSYLKMKTSIYKKLTFNIYMCKSRRSKFKKQYLNIGIFIPISNFCCHIYGFATKLGLKNKRKNVTSSQLARSKQVRKENKYFN
jgi:hypothetical protein